MPSSNSAIASSLKHTNRFVLRILIVLPKHKTIFFFLFSCTHFVDLFKISCVFFDLSVFWPFCSFCFCLYMLLPFLSIFITFLQHLFPLFRRLCRHFYATANARESWAGSGGCLTSWGFHTLHRDNYVCMWIDVCVLNYVRCKKH